MSTLKIADRLGEQTVAAITEQRADEEAEKRVLRLIDKNEYDVTSLTQYADIALEGVRSAYVAKETFYEVADKIEKALKKTGRSEKKDNSKAREIHSLLFHPLRPRWLVASNIGHIISGLITANTREEAFLRTLHDRCNSHLRDIWRHWHPADKRQTLLVETQEAQQRRQTIVDYYREIGDDLGMLKDAIEMGEFEIAGLLDLTREKILPALKTDMHKVFPEDQNALLADWMYRWHEIRTSSLYESGMAPRRPPIDWGSGGPMR